MKSTLAKQSGMKTSLVVGAAAIGAANLQAAIVYLDTSGLSLSVTVPELPVTADLESFTYDSTNRVLDLGGDFGKGKDRGALLHASAYPNAGIYLTFRPVGMTSGGARVSAVASSLLSGGAILAGTAIGGGGTIVYTTRALDHPLGSGLTDFYVGMRLWEGDTNVPERYNYGWASITTSADGLSATLNGVAFETEANVAINAGDTGVSAVPEPGSLVSLAALLSSAALIRARRKATAA
jgi:hypothetical protein